MSLLRLRNANVMAAIKKSERRKTFVNATKATECIKFLRVYILMTIMARGPNVKESKSKERVNIVTILRILISGPCCTSLCFIFYELSFNGDIDLY